MSIMRSILSAMPDSVVDKIKRYTNKKRLNKWNSEGCPVPPPHVVKQLAIKEYQQKSDSSLLVETGTYYGDMVFAMRKNFKKIYSIELSEYFYNKAVKKFRKCPNIEIVFGDSGAMLKSLVPTIGQTAIFWLDGHYSGGKTAKGEKECPVYDELASIFASPLKHTILIDDAREFIGEKSYPTIEELSEFISANYPNKKIEVKDDIIRIEPIGD